MKNHPAQVARRAVTETADDVRMTHAVERDRFVLKIFDERPFEIGVQIVLHKNVERFDDDLFMRRLQGGDIITRDINFGITATTEEFLNVVACVEAAVNKRKFSYDSVI